MQSHASRHVVSERLADLHPDLGEPFVKEIITDEIAVAYGRRGIQKLIAVLALEPGVLTNEQRAHALRVLLGMLTTQEHKTDATNAGLAIPVTRLIKETTCPSVRQLSCKCLGSLAQVRPGRQAVVDADGITALTGALLSSPEAAAHALQSFSVSLDGVAHLAHVHDLVIPALVALIHQPPNAPGDSSVTLAACQHAADTLAGVASSDSGVEACLRHAVPAALVHLSQQCVSGGFKMEPEVMPALQACATCMLQVARHPRGKTALRVAGAIPELGQMLVLCEWHHGALLAATAALMGISVEKESKQPVIEHVGKRLVQLLQGSGDSQIVNNVRAVLTSACEDLSARGLVQEELPAEDMSRLMYRGPLPPSPPDFRYQVLQPMKMTT